jgi:hypothetical protein
MHNRREFLATGLSGLAAAGCLRGAQQADGKHDVPWLADVQRPPARLPADAPDLRSPLSDANGQRIDSLDRWITRRGALRRSWLDFLGELRGGRNAGAPQVLAEERLDGCARQLIRYQSEPGVFVEAYLFRPTNRTGRRPGVAVFHSTVAYTIRQPAGLEGAAELHFGLKLARRGLVTLCPRCFLWQAGSNYQEQVDSLVLRHPGIKGMAKMLHDALVAVDLLAQMPQVDADRLGAVGHSLGAKEVVYLAAFDERIKVAVASEGGIGVRFSNWDAPWYLGPAVKQPGFVRDHHELLALAAPRAFLLIGGESADGDRSWPYIESVLPIYRLYGRSARIGLLNHRRGHALPPDAEAQVYEWIEAYL